MQDEEIILKVLPAKNVTIIIIHRDIPLSYIQYTNNKL